MTDAARQDREDAFRADAARMVQAVRHHLAGGTIPTQAAPLPQRVRLLADLIEADASTEHLQDAALAVVDSYDWPSPEASASGEGPVIDAAVLAAVERVRDAIDALDALD